MTLKPVHLIQLSVIVEAGSFQSAADRLNTNQPGLSRNMKLLEEQVGAPLFKKEGRDRCRRFGCNVWRVMG